MSDADSIIDALRSSHDRLADHVAGLSADDLAGPSGASEWDVAQVLSHLGSGAEIGLATLRAALGDGEPLGGDGMHAIWDRWNAMPRAEQAAGFVAANDTLTQAYEGLDSGVRETLRINLGFLPAPVDVATAASMRLNELALHSWDVFVVDDATATLPLDATTALMPRSGNLIGWIAKSEPLAGREVDIALSTVDPDTQWALHLGEHATLTPGVAADSTARVTMPAEAWLRLASGRLAPEHTPAGVAVSGDLDLALLRQVFPGY